MVQDTLRLVGQKLNEENILWAVGASVLLNSYGLIECPNDIDIFVSVKDIEKADQLLRELGEKKPQGDLDTYATRYFYEYVIHGVDLDVMAGFIINFQGGSYEYIFDEKSITDVKDMEGVSIPFTSLEDWYVIYQLIPGREAKVKLIEEYLESRGIGNRFILERSMGLCLPDNVRHRVQGLLKAEQSK